MPETNSSVPGAAQQNDQPAAEWLNLAFQSAGDGMVLCRQSACGSRPTILHANDALCRMLGYSTAELLSLDLADLFDPDSLCLSSLSELDYESTLRTKSGRRVHAEITTRSISIDGTPHLFSVIRDVSERRAALDALSASEHRFRATFENAAVGIAHVDLSGRFLRVNQRLCEITGYPLDELIQKTFQAITHPDDLAADLALTAQVMHGAIGSFCMEKRYFRKDGSIVWVNLTVSIQRESAGQPAYFISIIEDISQRKSAAQAHQDDRARLYRVLEASNDGYWEWHVPSGSIFVSPRWCEIFGRPKGADHIHFDEMRDLVHPDDFRSAQHILAPVLVRPVPGGHFQLECRLRRPSGSDVWVQIRGNVTSRNSAGRAIQLSGIVSDITVRKESEVALKNSAQRIRTLADAIPHIVWATTSDRSFYFNRRALEFTGHSVEQLQGEGRLECIHPDDRPLVISAWSTALQTGREYRIEYRMRRYDGAYIWFAAHAVPVFEAGGPVQWIGTCTDIHDRRLAEQALRESQDDLNRAQAVAHIGSWHFDIRRNLLRWSDETHRMFGVPADTPLTYETFLACVHPDDRQFVHRSVQDALKGASYDLEYRILVDNRVRWIRARGEGEYDSSHNLVGGIGSVQDITERKQAEGALRESEQLSRYALDAAQLGSWRYEPASGLISFDSRSRTHFGFTAGAVQLADIIARIHPADVGTVQKAIAVELDPANSTGQFAEEFRIILPSGDERWVSVQAHAHFEGEGPERRPVQAVGTSEDITARKLAEEALRESEERLRLALGATGLGLFDLYPGTGRLVWTQLGSRDPALPSVEGLNYETFLRLLHPKDRRRVDALVQKALRPESGGIFNTEFRTAPSNSRHDRWLAAWGRVLFDPEGHATRFIGVTLDITERKHADDALRESEARVRAHVAELQAIMDAVPAATFVTHDPGCARIAGSRLTYDILGLSPGANLSASFVDPDHPPAFRTMKDGKEISADHLPMQIAARTGKPVRDFEFEFVFPDGASRHLFGNAVPLFDHSGNPSGAVGAFIDITERRRVEQRLRHAQKLESIGVLAGGVAHDFNNLLTSVLGNASLALLDAPPSIRERLDRIVEAAQNAAALTRQLLAYAGKGQFEITVIDLPSLIQSSTALIRVSIPRNIDLVFDIPEILPPIRGDAAQIQQVVMNLVINASEAIGNTPHGTVSLAASTENIQPGPLATTLDLAPGPYVSLKVADTGCGMDEVTLSRIFDPFFTTKFTGRGLGLAAVQGILRSHNGAIAVRSLPSCGSTFTIYFPAIDAPRTPVQASIDSPSSRHTATILVVDDEPSIRGFAQAALEHFGHSVLTAADGNEALALLANRPSVDIILLDVVMPGAGGAETLSEIRRLLPHIPIIMTSGYNREEAIRSSDIPDDLPFLEKPFTVQTLCASVDNVLASRPS